MRKNGTPTRPSEGLPSHRIEGFTEIPIAVDGSATDSCKGEWKTRFLAALRGKLR